MYKHTFERFILTLCTVYKKTSDQKYA